MGGDNSSLQLFYEELNIGKHAHDWLLKSLGLVISKVVEEFLQYGIYHPLPYLRVCSTEVFPHLL